MAARGEEPAIRRNFGTRPARTFITSYRYTYCWYCIVLFRFALPETHRSSTSDLARTYPRRVAHSAAAAATAAAAKISKGRTTTPTSTNHQHHPHHQHSQHQHQHYQTRPPPPTPTQKNAFPLTLHFTPIMRTSKASDAPHGLQLGEGQASGWAVGHRRREAKPRASTGRCTRRRQSCRC